MNNAGKLDAGIIGTADLRSGAGVATKVLQLQPE
jgi:hypothetical protein